MAKQTHLQGRKTIPDERVIAHIKPSGSIEQGTNGLVIALFGSVLNLLFLLLGMTASPLKDWQSLMP
jgi:hypothetical protein